MAEYTFSKIQRGTNLYILKDADAARQEQADWNTNNGVKNLLEITAESQTINGLTFTVDKSKGTITVNGTATGSKSSETLLVVHNWDSNIISQGNGQYILTGCPAEGSTSTYYLYINNSYDSQNHIYQDVGRGITFNYYVGDSIVRIGIRGGTTVSNLIFKPMLRPAFIEDNTFTPYSMSNLELTQKVSSYSREYSPSISDDEAANITEGILTTYAAGLAGKSDGSFCVLRTYIMDTPSIGTSRRIQIAEFADGTRKTRAYSNNAWSSWV